MNIIKIDSHDLDHIGYTYILWLPSGQTVAGYENKDSIIAVNPNMIANALDNTTEPTKIQKSKTPFSDWSIPEKVFEVTIQGHANLFVMPVSDSHIVTAFDDSSLGHNVEDIKELQKTVQNKTIELTLRADSPFRTHSWALNSI